MHGIKLTDEVWQAIAARGKFGETEDQVLRRVFGLQPAETAALRPGRRGRGNRRIATKRMSASVGSGQLTVSFEDGNRNQWKLPERSDKQGIRKVRQTAIDWALSKGASDPGQTNHIRKALTEAGYHLTK